MPTIINACLSAPSYFNPCEFLDWGFKLLTAAIYVASSAQQSILTLTARPHCQREGRPWKRAASVHHSHAADLSGHNGLRCVQSRN